MAYFLKSIGLSKQPLPEFWWEERPELVTAVFFGNEPKSIQDGDLLIYYAVGGSKRVCAVARVESKAVEGFCPPPQLSPELLEKFHWKMDIALLHKCANNAAAPALSDFQRQRVGQGAYQHLEPEQAERMIAAIKKCERR